MVLFEDMFDIFVNVLWYGFEFGIRNDVCVRETK